MKDSQTYSDTSKVADLFADRVVVPGEYQMVQSYCMHYPKSLSQARIYLIPDITVKSRALNIQVTSEICHHCLVPVLTHLLKVYYVDQIVVLLYCQGLYFIHYLILVNFSSPVHIAVGMLLDMLWDRLLDVLGWTGSAGAPSTISVSVSAWIFTVLALTLLSLSSACLKRSSWAIKMVPEF